MKNTVLITFLVLALASCSFTTQPVPSTSPSNSPSPSATIDFNEYWLYQNTDYHFALTLPKLTYSLACPGPGMPIQATEFPDKVEIGNHDNCPGTDPKYLRGWTIYMAKNIASEKDADAFVKKVLGQGCEISEWSNKEFSIMPVKEADRATPLGSSCGFISQGKYRTFYSEKLKTIVFWSLTQEPEFLKQDTKFQYDDQILESFKFLQ